jgi:hypothetical protein
LSDNAGIRIYVSTLIACQGGRTVLFEDVAGVDVAVVVEVVVDRGMGGGKLLESFHVPELRRRSFSSLEWLV